MNTNNKIITRFAPSPTGRFHVGSARTTLYNYIYTLQNQGEFILRYEDTDRARSKVEYETDIKESLGWLGIKFETPYRQSERSDIYKKYLEDLMAADKIYLSEEEVVKEGQRSSVVRFRNPNKTVTFQDIIRGEITVDTTDLGDFVIAKSLEEPIYHFAVVVDDFESGITHVIRAEEHISNTPRQLLIQEALGAPRPQYAHIPMVLGQDKAKLSKRHGAKSVLEYRDEGYLPEALLNYLVLLGWHPSGGDEREIFTLDELVEIFNLEDVQKAGAVFSDEKLRWVNKSHLKKLSDPVYLEHLEKWIPQEIKALPQFSQERLAKALPTLRERVDVFSDISSMASSGELEYFFEAPDYFGQQLVWRQSDLDTTRRHLEHLQEISIKSAAEIWNSTETLKDYFMPYAEREGKGEVLWPLRFALCGVERSPDPFSLLYILGREESVNRLHKAINKL